MPVAAQTPRARSSGAGKTASFKEIAADAAAAREAGRLEDAIALYRRALATRPTWDEGHWYLGTLLYEQRRYAEARAAFAQLLRAQPSHAGAMALTGLCAFGQGEHDAALRALLKSRQLNIQQTPELADVVRYHAGILLTRFGEFEAANQILVELPADGMESPRVVEAFGLNLLRMPMLPGEIPDEASSRVQLAGQAGVAMATRQASQAASLLERLVAEYPTTPNVHYAWGVFLLAADPQRAMAEWRRELDVSPGHVAARLQLAAELLKQGDAASAQPYAEAAVQVAPQDFAPRLALGQVMLSLGETAAAVSELETGVTLAPASAQAHYLLAIAYARAGRPKDAERERATFTKLSSPTPPSSSR
jgi:tetratricopeptide (TPR) repeat protein